MAIDMVTLSIILGACWAICEVLALIPAIKSNSIFTLIVNVLKKLLGKE